MLEQAACGELREHLRFDPVEDFDEVEFAGVGRARHLSKDNRRV